MFVFVPWDTARRADGRIITKHKPTDMKKKLSFVFSCALVTSLPAFAGGYTTGITDTVNLQVQGSAVLNQRIGSAYSVSGSGVDVTTPGGLNAGTPGTATTAAVGVGAAYTTTPNQAFTFSESLTIGDSVGSASAVTGGVIAAPVQYGISTTQLAGDKGALAGTLSPVGVPTITAGGAGTTATAQRSVVLSVFD
jgi:hypothetical protein